MAEQQETKNKTMLYVAIAVIVVAVIAVALFFVFSGGSGIKNETITAENYEELLNRAEKEIGTNDDDLYYLAYSIVYHMMEDGLASAGSQETPSESDMYKNIFGKTLNQLIDEGKKYMEDNGVTIQQFKEQIENVGDLFSY